MLQVGRGPPLCNSSMFSLSDLRWAGIEAIKSSPEGKRCTVRSKVGFSGHLPAKSSEFRPARPSPRVDGALHGASRNVSEIGWRAAPDECVTRVV